MFDKKNHLSPSTLSSLHRAPSVSALTNFSLQEARMSWYWYDKGTWSLIAMLAIILRLLVLVIKVNLSPGKNDAHRLHLSQLFRRQAAWAFHQIHLEKKILKTIFIISGNFLCHHTMLCFSSSWLTPCPRKTITPVGNVCNCRGRPAWNGEPLYNGHCFCDMQMKWHNWKRQSY